MMKKIVFVFMVCFGCSQPPPSNASVVVSLPPYVYFVKKIAGSDITVDVLVPPGANPHIYEPSPRQIKTVSQASLWLRSGDPFESKIATVLKEQNSNLEIVDLTRGIPLLGGHEHCCHGHDEDRDLHVWLDPTLVAKQALTIEKALSARFPEKQQLFQEGLASLLQELASLNEEIANELRPFSGDAILVSHPAFGYFCAAYGLRQLSIEYEGKDPLPQDLAKTLKEAETAHVRAVFTQVQYNNKGAVLIAEKLNVPVHEVDPYSQDYPIMMRQLAGLIASGH